MLSNSFQTDYVLVKPQDVTHGYHKGCLADASKKGYLGAVKYRLAPEKGYVGVV
jgi:hypothetical protein